MSIAQENMWLETDSIGLGGVWIGIAPQRDRMDRVSEILGLPDNVKPFSILDIRMRQGSRRIGLMKAEFIL